MKVRIFILISLICSGLPLTSLADQKVDIRLGPGFPISENNFLPGESFSRNFSASNKTESSQDLLIKFENQLENQNRELPQYFLEEKILIEIKRLSDNQSLPLPIDNLAQAYSYTSTNPDYEDAIFFDTLTEEAENYQLIFTFDKTAGNEYQDIETKFSLTAGILSLESTEQSTSPNNDTQDDEEDEDEDEEDEDENDPLSPFQDNNPLLANFNAQATTPLERTLDTQEENGPAQIDNEAQTAPQVQGKQGQNDCRSLPWYLWAIALILSVGGAASKKLLDVQDGNYHWVLDLSITATAALVWYFLDSCRENIWFIYALPSLMLLLNISFLSFLGRKTG